MTVHSRIRSKFKHLKHVNWRFAPVLLAVIAVISVSYFSSGQPGSLSPEVKFTDSSKSGLQIVPASCPSTPDYTGQCDPALPPPGECSMYAPSYTVPQGQSVTFTWYEDLGNSAVFYFDSGDYAFTISPPEEVFFMEPWSQAQYDPSTGFYYYTGTVTVTPLQTTDYVLGGSWSGATQYPLGNNLNMNCDATITVVPASTPTCSVTFDQNPVPYGSQTTLNYSSTQATAFYINNVGYVGASGSTTVAPLATTDYTGSVTGYGGSNTCPATLSVTPPSTPTATIAASSTSIQTGQSTNITADFTPGGTQQPSATPTVIVLTSGTNWTVPNDWNSADNFIDVIGGGGGGGSPENGVAYAGSGGGGAFSQDNNLTLTPGAAVQYSIGSSGAGAATAGTAGNTGGDTWFNASSMSACLSAGSGTCIGAKGGGGGIFNGSSGAGGAAASGVGQIVYSGGNGGSNGVTGGGAAAGVSGVGGNVRNGCGRLGRKLRWRRWRRWRNRWCRWRYERRCGRLSRLGRRRRQRRQWQHYRCRRQRLSW